MPSLRIPAPLRAATGGAATVEVAAVTARGALAALEAAHPGTLERLVDDRGRLHRFVNLFVGEDDVRDLDGLDTAVATDDVLSIVPAVAGGAE